MIILNDIYRISKNYYKKFYFSKKMSNFFHSMHTLISTQWLNLHRNENNIKIVDATWNLTNKNYALDVIEKRIKGSIFFDIDKIAGKKK
jgi:3-mercaptopyruvate sulfurtransferase SseA